MIYKIWFLIKFINLDYEESSLGDIVVIQLFF
jgi:hypothetical protein